MRLGRFGRSSDAMLLCLGNKGSKSRSEAFSLIELLLVTAVLVVLITLVWTPGGGRRAGLAGLAKCKTNLERIYMAMQLYAHDYSGRFPMVLNASNSAAALDRLIPRFNSDTSVFFCPGRKMSEPCPQRLAGVTISYAYYMGAVSADGSTPLVLDPLADSSLAKTGRVIFTARDRRADSNHGPFGGNILSADGQVICVQTQGVTFPVLRSGVILLGP